MARTAQKSSIADRMRKVRAARSTKHAAGRTAIARARKASASAATVDVTFRGLTPEEVARLNRSFRRMTGGSGE